MKTINVGLIGFGLSGKTFHYPFLNSMKQFDLKMINSSRVNEISALNSEVEITQNLEKILQNEDIDLVINAAPNEFHYKITKRALMAGKHVLVEKPFVVESSEGQELIDLAKKKGLVLSVFHNRRLDADFRTVQKLLDRNELGDIKIFESHFDRMRPFVREGKWKEKKGKGSGILYDLGAHLIDQALILFGMPDSVFADMDSQKNNDEVIDYFHLILKYGKKRVILNGSSFGELSPRFHLQGEKGQYIKYGFDPQESRLLVGKEALDPCLGLESESEWGRLVLWSGPESVESGYPSLRGEYLKFYENLAETIHGKEKLLTTPEQALEVIKLIELCINSYEYEQTIELTN